MTTNNTLTIKPYVLQIATTMQLSLNEKDFQDACNLKNKSDINKFLFNLKNLKVSRVKKSKPRETLNSTIENKVKKLISGYKNQIAESKREILNCESDIKNTEKDIENISKYKNISDQIQEIEREGFWKVVKASAKEILFKTTETVKIPVADRVYDMGFIDVKISLHNDIPMIFGKPEPGKNHSFMNSHEGSHWASICFGNVTPIVDQARNQYDLVKIFHFITLLIQSPDSHAGYTRHSENVSGNMEIKVEKKEAPRAKRVAKKNVSTTNGR